ncbi:MAG: general secretion pathway protein GspC [Myxococcales bacterium]|nr:general secretion pathway protein GspC [Myxococcales bacterium]
MGSPKHIAIAIVLSSLASTAFFLAQGTTGLLASALLEIEPTSASPRSGVAAAVTGRERRDDTNILRRNIFDHEQGSIVDAPRTASDTPSDDVEVGPTTDPSLVDWSNPPTCEGSVRLVAAVMNPANPDWSFAAIVGTSGKAMLYRRGQSVDGREVVHISSNRVFMAPSSGGGCQIKMFGDEEPVAPRVAAAPAEVAEPPSQDSDGIGGDDMEAGIQRISDTNFNIDRSLVDRVLENQAELMRTARVIPHEEGGRTVGVKLYGIRRNSLLGRLGVQNGDMLRTINGYDMASPDSALEAYARLRTADHLTLSIVRRGQPTTIDYNIR